MRFTGKWKPTEQQFQPDPDDCNDQQTDNTASYASVPEIHIHWQCRHQKFDHAGNTPHNLTSFYSHKNIVYFGLDNKTLGGDVNLLDQLVYTKYAIRS